jgi:O-antigen/teichoic acid export membrane protein
MSLKKNLFKNGIANMLQRVIRISEQLLLVPFFISSWGIAYYGEWLTLTIIPTIIGFSDLGFGTAAANSFILKYASDEKQKAANLLKCGFFSITLIVIIGIILSVFFIFILDFYHIFDKSLIRKNDAILAVSFLMISRIISFYQQLFEAYYKAARKASFALNIQSIYLISILISSLIILLFGKGIVLFALSNLIITIVFTVFYGFVARRVLPIHKEYKGVVLIDDIKDIIHKGFGYLLSPIWNAIFFQGTTLVVRLILGPVSVTIFNTVRTLTRTVNQANAVLITSFLPELQFEIAAGNLLKARKIFRFALIIISIVSVVGMLSLYFGGLWFYELWTHKSISPPLIMLNLLISGIFFNAIWWMASDILIAVNKPYDFTIAGVIVSLIAVSASYVFSKQFGLTGAAMGSLLLDIILFLYVFPRSCKLIEQPISNVFVDILTDKNDFYSYIKLKLRRGNK